MRRLLALLLFLITALPATAQDLATLVADTVTITPDNRIVASGNVEVLYGETRLRAASVTYSQELDQVIVGGPITLIGAAGEVILADGAELDADLRNGILRGARLVLNQQLQLASAEINRVDGRYTQLYKTVASSCQVCGANSVPLWRIRATRVTHDQEERQLYFQNARLEVLGTPILWLPRMRLPDPTLDRASGFLIPQFRNNTLLGAGIKVPYFFKLGDHADLTLTAYGAQNTRTLETRFRRALRFGDIELNGAVSDDELTTDDKRWYLIGEGVFDLPLDFNLTATVELVSDEAYLLDYGYSSQDRLRNGIEIERTRRNEYIGGRLIHFRTLRDSEIPIEDQLPSVVSDVIVDRRYDDPWFGGTGILRFDTHAHARESNLDVLGRDVSRVSARANWRRSEVFGPGIVMTALGEINADLYHVTQDSRFPETTFQITPFIGTELRWPMVRYDSSGVVQTFEPVAQVIWSQDAGTDVPNEDSTFTEFDEGNLFSLNRFPGSDTYERGLRANIGASWSRTNTDGDLLRLTFGRVLRTDNLGQFTEGSGLDGHLSDWLGAVQYQSGRLSLLNRAIFADDLDFTRNETRFAWTEDRYQIASTYHWSNGTAPLLADGTAGVRAPATSEMTLDASYDVTRNWTSSMNWRYDFVENSFAEAGLGLTYENECVAVGLSVSRRFTSSTSVQPSTDIGLSVRLTGFGTGTRGVARHTCG